MQDVTLNNGISMPILGFGVYQIADPEVCRQNVGEAIAIGYRLVDTAAAYTNEKAVGAAIASSPVSRDDLFITTKLWIQDQGYDEAKRAFYQSLENLGLDYLDLYLIHWPIGDVYGSWRAMEELYAQGLVRAIGVSNFPPDRLMDLMLNFGVKPAVNQIEINPFCQQKDAIAFMKKNGVQAEAWGPFAQGRMDIFSNPALTEIGAQYGKTVAQVTLRWLIQQGAAVVQKSCNAEHIADNLNVFDFELTPADMEKIAALDTGKSTVRDPSDPESVRLLHGLKIGQLPSKD